MGQVENLTINLLKWYDVNRRSLPWRAPKGEKSNPYHVYLSEIFLQQTTVTTVIDYFNRFIQKWPTLNDLSLASLDDILKEFQGLGYYSRAKNLKKSIDLFSANGGIPKELKTLLAYPGIGDYTAKAIAAIAFNEPFIPVDGNVIRVFSRYFGLTTPLPFLKKDVLLQAQKIDNIQRPSDFAQSLMDLGSMICKPQNPDCLNCPLMTHCIAYKKDIALILPNKSPKIKKPKKIAIAYIFETEDFILLQKNPSTGLLSNLWGVPTSIWEEESEERKDESLSIKHVFTHFSLTLKIERYPLDLDINLPPAQQIVFKKNLSQFPLSTLMKKVLKKAGVMTNIKIKELAPISV